MGGVTQDSALQKGCTLKGVGGGGAEFRRAVQVEKGLRIHGKIQMRPFFEDVFFLYNQEMDTCFYFPEASELLLLCNF